MKDLAGVANNSSWRAVPVSCAADPSVEAPLDALKARNGCACPSCASPRLPLESNRATISVTLAGIIQWPRGL